MSCENTPPSASPFNVAHHLLHPCRGVGWHRLGAMLGCSRLPAVPEWPRVRLVCGMLARSVLHCPPPCFAGLERAPNLVADADAAAECTWLDDAAVRRSTRRLRPRSALSASTCTRPLTATCTSRPATARRAGSARRITPTTPRSACRRLVAFPTRRRARRAAPTRRSRRRTRRRRRLRSHRRSPTSVTRPR